MVVVPTTNQDVAATVKYANKHSIPFLAVNHGHGSSVDLNKLRHGVNIYIHNLDSITIAHDGASAELGGGVYADLLIKTLAEKGKVAATGACTCVGVAGAGLGGGFGRYQGLYGLVADNFLKMTVVTADGSIVTVNDRQNADLFWAMRGAGHNFGIVAGFKYKIYDSVPMWYTVNYQYTHDKLDDIFTELNRLNNNGKQPGEVITYAVFAYNPGVSDKPVIIVAIWYAGPELAALRYTRPFLNLQPALVSNQTVPYADLADAVGTGVNSPVCQPGMSAASFPVGTQKFNTTANHQVYDLYSDSLPVTPSSGARSCNLKDTLWRKCTVYAPFSISDDIAPQYGHQIRDLFHAGDGPGGPLNTYVNYAYGDETLEQMYGYEEWRIQKLRALKKKWDPYGRFNWSVKSASTIDQTILQLNQIGRPSGFDEPISLLLTHPQVQEETMGCLSPHVIRTNLVALSSWVMYNISTNLLASVLACWPSAHHLARG
ncbi:MAG: hypothetical protein Q9209_005522 [Squamulea sp. 1 TL-2023]